MTAVDRDGGAGHPGGRVGGEQQEGAVEVLGPARAGACGMRLIIAWPRLGLEERPR